jgi:hypothetical protein
MEILLSISLANDSKIFSMQLSDEKAKPDLSSGVDSSLRIVALSDI